MTSTYQISVEFVDIDADTYPELLVEVRDPQKPIREQVVHAFTVYASQKNGSYDTVATIDADGDGDEDEDDKRALLDFAQTAVHLLRRDKP